MRDLENSALSDKAPVPPLVYQLFFDAHRLEAVELRALGYTSVARALLYYTLRRPWEHALPSKEWVASECALHLVSEESIDKRACLDVSLYDHVDLALEELAACEEELGNLQRRNVILQTRTWDRGRAAYRAVR